MPCVAVGKADCLEHGHHRKPSKKPPTNAHRRMRISIRLVDLRLSEERSILDDRRENATIAFFSRLQSI